MRFSINKEKSRFLAGFFLLGIAIAAVLNYGRAASFIRDTVLATLLVYGFFFDVFELAFFSLVAGVLLRLQPGISIELILFILLPPAARLAAHILPLSDALNAFILLIIGIFLFYFVSFDMIAGGSLRALYSKNFLVGVAGAVLWGIAAFALLYRFYGKKS